MVDDDGKSGGAYRALSEFFFPKAIGTILFSTVLHGIRNCGSSSSEGSHISVEI